MGVLDAIKFNNWRITCVDVEVNLLIDGQYPLDGGLEYGQDPQLSEDGAPGSAEPFMQWVRGGARYCRFRSVFHADNPLEDLRPRIEAIEALTQRDPVLGRAPRIVFTWGDYSILGFVSGFTGRLTALFPITGGPRAYAFEIEIRGAPDSVDVLAGGETQYVTLARGETLESLGARYLGSALRGELIRRINPAVAVAGEDAGTRVKVFEATHPEMRGEVRPWSPAFGSGWEAEVVALARSREDRGRRWTRLPEFEDEAVNIPIVVPGG